MTNSELESFRSYKQVVKESFTNITGELKLSTLGHRDLSNLFSNLGFLIEIQNTVIQRHEKEIESLKKQIESLKA